MRAALVLACVSALVLLPVAPASAQLAVSDAPVVYGHHHVNATSVAAHTRFLVEGLGGAPVTIAGRQVVKFPNVLVFVREQAPTAGSVGTTADHLGLSVPDLRPVIARLKAAGHTMVTRESVPAEWTVTDDMATNPLGGSPIAFVLGPDGLKVELVQVAAQAAPVTLNHVHFFGPDREAMQAWYVKALGATAAPPAAGNRFLRATLPGVGLNFTASPRPVVATKGRVVDHVGFEVNGLPALLRKLEGLGIVAENMRRVPELGIDIAFITDPWCTLIELTEGLDAIR